MKTIIFPILFLLIHQVQGQIQAVDKSFGINGIVNNDTIVQINAIDIQSDGKLIAIGNTKGNSNYGSISRYNIDGTLDTSFGFGGHVSGLISAVNDLAIQSDGRIVTVGLDDLYPAIAGSMKILRVNSNGSFDTTFGTNGQVSIQYADSSHTYCTSNSSSAASVYIQADGKILVGGSYKHCRASCDIWMWGLLRLHANGSIDSSFRRFIDLYPGSVRAIEIQSNGRILMCTEFLSNISPCAYPIDLARIKALDSTGSWDTTFSTTRFGVVVFASANGIGNIDLSILNDDKILVAAEGDTSFAIKKYTSDGKMLDSTFASNGVIKLNYGISDVQNYDSGKIVAVGKDVLAMYNAKGVMDSMCTYNLFAYGKDSIPALTAMDVKVQNDGKLIVAGPNPSIIKTSSILRLSAKSPFYLFAIEDSVCEGFEFNGKKYFNSGIYFDTLGSVQGCDSVVSLNLTMKEVNVDVIQTGPNLVTTATNASYQWLDCLLGNPISGETNQSFAATFNGSYAVIVTQDGCTDTSSCFEVTGVGIRELTSEDIHVYPNPSNGSFMIDIPKYPNTQITILNLQESIIYQKQLTNNHKIEINLDAPKGIYFLRIENEAGVASKKIVIH